MTKTQIKEHFIVSTFSGFHFKNIVPFFVCLFFSVIIIYPILGFKSMEAIISIILLFLIFYVIVSSMTSENLSNELPSTLYPSLPHTGLDGISLNSYITGLDTREYLY
jgi:hypothetical protein